MPKGSNLSKARRKVSSIELGRACEMNTPSDSDFEGRKLLQKWLNKSMKIQMTDGRVLIGIFVCTDQDCNVILGSCHEYLSAPECCSEGEKEEPRVLGLAMVPGHHIVSIHTDESPQEEKPSPEKVDKAQNTEPDTGRDDSQEAWTQDSEVQDTKVVMQDSEAVDGDQHCEDKAQDAVTGAKTPDTSDKMLDTSDKMPDTSDKTSDTSDMMPDITDKMPDTDDKTPDTQDTLPILESVCSTVESTHKISMVTATDSKENLAAETQSQSSIIDKDEAKEMITADQT